MRLLDLFSGIGGFSMAASWAGIETAAFCEIDPYCQQVLHKHWHHVPLADDIFKLRGDEFGPVDIVSGGFPCQPFSVAGKREGAADDRHLWPEMLRVIQTARPAWVVGENVAGIIGMELDNVLSDLEGIGYEAEALVIPACAVDAPHRRDRVWIVAYSERSGTWDKSRSSLLQRWERTEAGTKTIRQTYGEAGSGGIDTTSKDVANATQRGSRRRSAPGTTGQPTCGGETLADSRCVGDNGRSGKNKKRTTSEIERRRGIADTWLPEPGVGRVAYGVPRRVDRLKSLGNAIVPQVAYRIFKAITMVEVAG